MKLILDETFRKVSKEVLDQVKGVSSLIKYFVMTYKNPNLSGLSILDTQDSIQMIQRMRNALLM